MLVDALLQHDRRRPASIAVGDRTSTLTYRNLTSLAVVMHDVVHRECGGPNVGIMLPCGAAFAGTLFGALWAGKTPVPLNFLLRPGELAEIVRDAGIDLILSIGHFEKTNLALPARIILVDQLPIKRRILWARLRPRPPLPEVDPDATAVLLYTSGTSAAPKGVELSFRNLRSNCDGIIQAVGLRDDDRFLCVLPPFHVFGLTANVLVPAIRGIEVRAIPRFSSSAIYRAVERYQPTIMMAIPSMYGALLRHKTAAANAFRSLRLMVSGGEPLPDSIADGFRERFGVELCEGYGLTETSPVISLSVRETNRRGAVGRPLHNLELRIVREDGRQAAAGEEGEIRVRGPSVMRGYHHRPDETSAVLDAEGWFSTGDIGTLDGDGFLRITGRKKEMIIVGGENVFPREIETVLDQHAAVAEAAVIGVPDRSRGEVPLAFVILNPDHTATDQELRSYVRQHLAGYKVPRRVQFVEELPRGPTGKVAKRLLATLAQPQ